MMGRCDKTLSVACRSALSQVGAASEQRRTASRMLWALAIAMTVTFASAGAQESAPAATSAPASAAETRPMVSSTESRPVMSKGAGSAAMDWAQSAGALVVVVAIILALRMMLKRIAPKARAAGGSGPVEIIARTGISPRQQLLLVRLGRRMLLLGATPNSLDTLAEIADADEAVAIFEAAGRDSDAFRKLLAAAKPAEARR